MGRLNNVDRGARRPLSFVPFHEESVFSTYLYTFKVMEKICSGSM